MATLEELNQGLMIAIEDADEPLARAIHGKIQAMKSGLSPEAPAYKDPAPPWAPPDLSPQPWFKSPSMEELNKTGGPNLAPGEAEARDAEARSRKVFEDLRRMSPGTRFLAGTGFGLVHALRQAGNFSFSSPAGPEMISDKTVKGESDEWKYADQLGGVEPGRVVGSMVPAVAASMATGGGPALAEGLGAAAPQVPALLRLALGLGVEGAVQGGVFSDPGQRGTGALVGGGVGTAIPLALRAGHRTLSGLAEASPEVQALIARDPEYARLLSTGQTAGPNSLFGTLESMAQHSPGLFGQRSRAAVTRGLEVIPTEYEKVLNASLGGQGPVAGGTLHDRIRYYLGDKTAGVRGAFGDAYESVFGTRIPGTRRVTQTFPVTEQGTAPVTESLGTADPLVNRTVKRRVSQLYTDTEPRPGTAGYDPYAKIDSPDAPRFPGSGLEEGTGDVMVGDLPVDLSRSSAFSESGGWAGHLGADAEEAELTGMARAPDLHTQTTSTNARDPRASVTYPDVKSAGGASTRTLPPEQVPPYAMADIEEGAVAPPRAGAPEWTPPEERLVSARVFSQEPTRVPVDLQYTREVPTTTTRQVTASHRVIGRDAQAVRDVPVSTAKLDRTAINASSGTGATREERRTVGQIYDNIMEPFREAGRTPTIADLHEARGRLRDAIRGQARQENYSAVEALKKIESAMTDDIYAAMPEAQRLRLQQIDKGYGPALEYETAIDRSAVAQGRNVAEPTSMSPAETTRVHREGMGATGATRNQPRALRQAMEAVERAGLKAPVEGRTHGTAHTLLNGLVDVTLGPAADAALYAPGMQAFLKGQTGWQEALLRASHKVPDEVINQLRQAAVAGAAHRATRPNAQTLETTP